MSVWMLPLAVLGGGLLVGLIAVVMSRGRGGRDHLAEKRAVKDSLMDQLRSLRADRMKLEPAIFEERWARLLDAAAASLRDLDREREQPTGMEPEEVAAPSGRRPWGSVVAALVFFVLAGYGLAEFSAPRLEGGSLTGTDLSGASARQALLDEAKATLEQNPEDLDALNLLTYDSLLTGDLGVAMKYMDQCRKVAPEDPEVRTHLAILQLSIGMSDKAKVELDAALEEVPNSSKALFWRGLAALRSQERESAVAYLERALENAVTTDERRMATQALGEARRPPAKVMLRGSLGLASGVTRPTSGVLYVMVRRSPDGGGPPAAAVRLDPRGVPGTFSVTDRDLMMGGEWPAQVWVEARLDTDGDPMTKDAADLVAPIAGPFEAQATGVALVLNAGVKPPSSSEGEPGVAASGATARVSGSIEVADGIELPKGGRAFLIVRRTQTRQGPPVAAVQLPISGLPGSFSVGDKNLMMGGTWPEQVWIQVRADADGDAMTRSDDDVSSPVVGPLKSGTLDVVLTLGE